MIRLVEARVIRDICLIIAIIFIVAIANNPASARIHGGAAAASSCNLSWTDNGCAASVGGSVLVSNMLTGYTGTNYTNYTQNQNWCGVSYYCGQPQTSNAGLGTCGLSSNVDPATAPQSGTTDNPPCGVLPLHCPYSTIVVSAQLTGSQVVCHLTSGYTLHGFNMCAVGGHTSTYLYTDTADTSGNAINVQDNQWCGDAFSYYQNAFMSWSSGTTSPIHILRNNMDGAWLASFSTQGSGTGCTASGQAVTCSSSSGFAVGQFIYSGAGFSSNTRIIAVSGTNFTTDTNNTISSGEAVTAVFQMGGGIGCNTNGTVDEEYNSIQNVNGRGFTCSGVAQATMGSIINRYNFINQVCIYTSGIAHWEQMENVQAASPSVSTNYPVNSYLGNVYYQPSQCASTTTTAAIFISTGFINGSPVGTYLNTYTTPDIENNLVLMVSGPQSSAALATWGGSVLSGLTIKGNVIDKGPGTYYSLSNGSPSDAGNPNGTSSKISFFHATHNASTHQLTLVSYEGGASIATDGSAYADWSGGGCPQITGLVSGTPNTAGAVYSTVGGVTVGSSTNMRSAPAAIGTAPTVSGNIDPTSGSSIDSVVISRTTGGTNPSVYPSCTG